MRNETYKKILEFFDKMVDAFGFTALGIIPVVFANLIYKYLESHHSKLQHETTTHKTLQFWINFALTIGATSTALLSFPVSVIARCLGANTQNDLSLPTVESVTSEKNEQTKSEALLLQWQKVFKNLAPTFYKKRLLPGMMNFGTGVFLSGMINFLFSLYNFLPKNHSQNSNSHNHSIGEYVETGANAFLVLISAVCFFIQCYKIIKYASRSVKTSENGNEQNENSSEQNENSSEQNENSSLLNNPIN